MKSLKTVVLILCMVLGLWSWTNYAIIPTVSTESSSAGQILAFRPLTLLPSTDTAALERFARKQLTPTFKNQVPGVESYIIKGQRGDKKGKYAHLLIFDSENTRNFYFPYEHSGESNMPEAALTLWRPGQIMLLDSLPKYAKPLQETQTYTDYIFIE